MCHGHQNQGTPAAAAVRQAGGVACPAAACRRTRPSICGGCCLGCGAVRHVVGIIDHGVGCRKGEWEGREGNETLRCTVGARRTRPNRGPVLDTTSMCARQRPSAEACNRLRFAPVYSSDSAIFRLE